MPFLFSAMLGSSMLAMKHNTLGTVSVFRNVAPLATLLVERMFRVPMQVNTATVLALLTIILGVTLYHVNTIQVTRGDPPAPPWGTHRPPRGNLLPSTWQPTARPPRGDPPAPPRVNPLRAPPRVNPCRSSRGSASRRYSST